MEEGLMRGLVLRVLKPTGTTPRATQNFACGHNFAIDVSMSGSFGDKFRSADTSSTSTV